VWFLRWLLFFGCYELVVQLVGFAQDFKERRRVEAGGTLVWGFFTFVDVTTFSAHPAGGFRFLENRVGFDFFE
jgi:hypothetical protein